jgi:hypothetical protein
MVLVAGCAPERLSSLPVQAPAGQVTATPVASPSGTIAASPTGPAIVPPGRPAAPPGRSPPVTTPTAEPTQAGSATPTCRGAVRHEVDLSNNERLDTWMCFQTGGVLRLRGIGPGLVTADPPEPFVDLNYAAAVQDIAFLRPGTVTLTITRDERIDTITVVVNT